MQSISGSTVSAQDGFQTDLKFIKIVPANSKEPVRVEQASAQTARQVGILQPFADHLKKFLTGAVSGARILQILKRKRGFRAAVAEARLNKQALVTNFVVVFPDLFKHEMRGNTFEVSPVLPTISESAGAAAASSSLQPPRRPWPASALRPTIV